MQNEYCADSVQELYRDGDLSTLLKNLQNVNTLQNCRTLCVFTWRIQDYSNWKIRAHTQSESNLNQFMCLGVPSNTVHISFQIVLVDCSQYVSHTRTVVFIVET